MSDNLPATDYSHSTYKPMRFRWPRLFTTGCHAAFAIVLMAVSTIAAADSRVARILHGTQTITGKVVFAGRREKSKPMPVFKSRAFCGATVPDETLLVGADGGVANAVVMFHPLEKSQPPQPGRLTLDNKHCAFTPHVQAGVVGSELLLKNSDPILHTVHARMGSETLFNVGLPTWRKVSKRLDRTGVIRITCDVLHTWMSATIVVTDSSYFAVTDDNGRFAVDALPLGSYDMEVWHERLGARQQRITVGADSLISLNVVYAPEESKR